MYRIYDKPEAIKRVQRYLATASNPEIFVAPTGFFDENTALSVKDFQLMHNLEPTGAVDYTTFTLLYKEYLLITKTSEVRRITDAFITFPLLPGYLGGEMLHINRMMRATLDHYGITHSLRDSNFYSDETANAVKILRKIYLLEEGNIIDEEFYQRLIKDQDSIARFRSII